MEVTARAGPAARLPVGGGDRAQHLDRAWASSCWSPTAAGQPGPAVVAPDRRRQAVERTQHAELTCMATDIVAGLRILRGIGGEHTFGRNYADQSQRVRRAGVSAGLWQSATEALAVLLPGIFLVILMWTGHAPGARRRHHHRPAGRLPGLRVVPHRPGETFFEFFQKLTRGMVSARKAIAVLRERAAVEGPERTSPTPPRRRDRRRGDGFGRASAGELTVVVCAVPDESAALADRIGRYLPADEVTVPPVTPRSSAGPPGASTATARRAAARSPNSTPSGQPVLGCSRSAGSTSPRRSSPTCASGSWCPTPARRCSPARSRTRSIRTAASPPRGRGRSPHRRRGGRVRAHARRLAGPLDERGRGLSGGQRQRLVLARALDRQADVLVLVEPTSAVDAHTEAEIAERLAAHRRGRTTIVVTVSPLLLHHADRVVLLEDGRSPSDGTHDELLGTTRPTAASSPGRWTHDDDPPLRHDRSGPHRDRGSRAACLIAGSSRTPGAKAGTPSRRSRRN